MKQKSHTELNPLRAGLVPEAEFERGLPLGCGTCRRLASSGEVAKWQPRPRNPRFRGLFRVQFPVLLLVVVVASILAIGKSIGAIQTADLPTLPEDCCRAAQSKRPRSRYLL